MFVAVSYQSMFAYVVVGAVDALFCDTMASKALLRSLLNAGALWLSIT
jgi:hypothetical protein